MEYHQDGDKKTIGFSQVANILKLDAALDAGGVPSPRNLYYVDEPDYEDTDLPAN